MQKIQSYLYPNRVILLADVAGFTVENKVVYARNVKIYQGVDNVIEFDVQNADQKRIDLTTLSDIEMNIMDTGGKALSNSPYYPDLLSTATATNATIAAPYPVGQAITTTITIPTANILGTFLPTYQLTGTNIVGPVIISGVSSDIDSATTTLTVTFPNQTVQAASGVSINCIVKGLLKVTIPQDDIDDLDSQYLTYSLTALDQLGNSILLYTNSYFEATGTLEIIGNATPTFRDEVIYDEFVGEINFMGNVTNHTPAIPCKFYEAEATQNMSFSVSMTNFIGTIYVEATEDMTVAVSSFINAPQLQSITYSVPTTTTITFNNVPVFNSLTGKNYNFMRVSWQFPDVWQYGSQQNPALVYGMVNSVTVLS
jgi:hypothetical protein